MKIYCIKCFLVIVSYFNNINQIQFAEAKSSKSSKSNDTLYSEDTRPEQCRAYEKSMTTLLKTQPDVAKKFLTDDMMPQQVDYGKILSNGCVGFATQILGWPEQLIMGGVKRNGENVVTKVESFQTVMLLGAAGDMFARFNVRHSKLLNECIYYKKTRIQKRTFDPPGKAGWMKFADNQTSHWTIANASAIITAWQRKFTAMVG
jgi:hypothetical protein